jgi:hypothetical protein
MKTRLAWAFRLLAGAGLLVSALAATPRQAENPQPPDQVVKLIFIHHSTGENWLADGYGDLGRTLAENNYFVSDTNYGWGPDSIGDRTDIPDWVEWFASDRTPTYMAALFQESDPHAAYSRPLADPGGENTIILFKSCFPNSALEGHPNDPPGSYAELSVSGAKYVYNTILQYFATRPDKLFVVITAPPLSDRTYAQNARAFNNWLVHDWLRENHYPLNNVAVFDFYNVLTDPNAHHRFKDGQIEHLTGQRNTLYYPSDDDHPSARGSRKATEEFVPLLNVFYHRWQASLPLQPTLSPPPTLTGERETPPPTGSALLDDLEHGPLPGTSGWEGYYQDGANTTLDCAPAADQVHSGAQALRFSFDVAANSWATCGFYFDTVQNWSAGQGLVFYLRADRAGLPFSLDLYGGSPAERSTYTSEFQTPPGSEREWVRVELPWAEFRRAEWEENAGSPLDPRAITGFSLGLSAPETARLSGTLWLDDLALLGQPVSPPPTTPPPVPTAEPTPTEETGEEKPGRPALCGGSMAVPLALISLLWWPRRRRST